MMRIVTIILFLLGSTALIAQSGTKIDILNADELKFDEQVAPGAQRLIGNVRVKHENAILRCDSAWLYQRERVKAFGNVHFMQGDTLVITGDRLEYDSKDRTAEITGDVQLTDSDMVLTTDQLNYDLAGRVGYYTTGGRIVSRKENNVLTSKEGVYSATAKEFTFRDSVRLVHPEYTIVSDTLRYSTPTGIAYFHGPTNIQQEGTNIYCEEGWYDTRNDLSSTSKNARIDYGDQLLKGDSLFFDRSTGKGIAIGNVSVLDTVNDLLVIGHWGEYDKHTGHSLVTDSALLLLDFGGDTLHLHGDTLLATTDSATEARIVRAFHRVRFFKDDLQGVCDSLVYSQVDSVIRLYIEPVLWSGTDQITGDHVRITMRGGKPDQMFVEENAFLASMKDSVNVDQVSGTMMTGFFKDNEMERVIAEGNCRTVYFAREETDSTETIIGVNRADCSRIRIGLNESEVQRITFLTEPDGVMYPVGKAPAEELRLDGLIWREEERPKGRGDVF